MTVINRGAAGGRAWYFCRAGGGTISPVFTRIKNRENRSGTGSAPPPANDCSGRFGKVSMIGKQSTLHGLSRVWR